LQECCDFATLGLVAGRFALMGAVTKVQAFVPALALFWQGGKVISLCRLQGKWYAGGETGIGQNDVVCYTSSLRRCHH
jgi:hypothetical protein